VTAQSIKHSGIQALRQGCIPGGDEGVGGRGGSGRISRIYIRQASRADGAAFTAER
jgi:hypothetical protein